MCGIIGYTGPEQVLDILIDGLTTLEYRGYDSAGVAVVSGSAAAPSLRVVKRGGKLAKLRHAVEGQDLRGTTGLGHTRWATHGEPNDRNAHPHLDASGELAVIHNGIIENYAALKAELVAAGHELASETDTEVVAHLIGALYDREAAEDGAPRGEALAVAVRAALRRVEGAFAIAVVDVRDPEVIVASRREAPLVLGHRDDASLLSSDVAGLIAHTRDIEALLDDQVAVLTPEGIRVTDLDGAEAEGHRYTVDWDVAAAEKQGYPHFMLKEIHEQPTAVRRDAARAHRRRGPAAPRRAPVRPAELRSVDKVYIVACGTSYHAGMVAKYAIEHWARIGVEVEIASEFRYRDPILDHHTLVVAISQSGETADTIAAAAHARDQRAKVVAITNVVGSSLSREADAVLYTRAGPRSPSPRRRRSPPRSSRCTSSRCTWRRSGASCSPTSAATSCAGWRSCPTTWRRCSSRPTRSSELAGQFADASYVMFVGRHVGLPIAYEGALKLKEISYLHAEGFAAGEMKHGPIALIDEGGPVVALATAGTCAAR
jgi:glutamine---fructose-6-phosphate transaminase (isomerizing)